MKLRPAVVSFVVTSLFAMPVVFAEAPPYVVPEFVPVLPQKLEARTLREFPAPEADQGVAVDATYFYPVDNSVIGKYRKDTGEFVARWVSPKGGPVGHLNSCYAERQTLWCANSNYPDTPIANSLERFDSGTAQHSGSWSLGMTEEGSLNFFGPVDGGWLAVFAHYDGEHGGHVYKGARFSSAVLFDVEWRRKGGYLFPDSFWDSLPAGEVPSGGQVGPDGLLYVTGHDAPMIFVFAKPRMGTTLVHVATIDAEIEGQAFAWDFSAERTLYAIDRRQFLVRVLKIPGVTLDHPNATRFKAASSN